MVVYPSDFVPVLNSSKKFKCLKAYLTRPEMSKWKYFGWFQVTTGLNSMRISTRLKEDINIKQPCSTQGLLSANWFSVHLTLILISYYANYEKVRKYQIANFYLITWARYRSYTYIYFSLWKIEIWKRLCNSRKSW